MVSKGVLRAGIEPQLLEQIKTLTSELTNIQNSTILIDSEIDELHQLKKIAEDGGSKIDALQNVIGDEKLKSICDRLLLSALGVQEL